MRQSELKTGYWYIIPPTEADKFIKVEIPTKHALALCDSRPHKWDGNRFDCWDVPWAFICFDFEALELAPHKTKAKVPATQYAKENNLWLTKEKDGRWFGWPLKPFKEQYGWMSCECLVKTLDKDKIEFPDIQWDMALISPEGEMVRCKPDYKPNRGDPIFVWDDDADDTIPAVVVYFRKFQGKKVEQFSWSSEGEGSYDWDNFRKYDPALVGVPRKDWPRE
jgi:hypothetical protein